MKVRINNNAELIIEANQNKEGDYEKAMQVAEEMANSDSAIVIASAEEGEYVHLTAVWNNFQAGELKSAYQVAKKAVGA